jgi:hypothetical protein
MHSSGAFKNCPQSELKITLFLPSNGLSTWFVL